MYGKVPRAPIRSFRTNALMGDALYALFSTTVSPFPIRVTQSRQSYRPVPGLLVGD